MPAQVRGTNCIIASSNRAKDQQSLSGPRTKPIRQRCQWHLRTARSPLCSSLALPFRPQLFEPLIPLPDLRLRLAFFHTINLLGAFPRWRVHDHRPCRDRVQRFMRPIRDASQVGEVGLQTPHVIHIVRRRRRVRGGLGRFRKVAFRGFGG